MSVKSLSMLNKKVQNKIATFVTCLCYCSISIKVRGTGRGYVPQCPPSSTYPVQDKVLKPRILAFDSMYESSFIIYSDVHVTKL